MEVQGTNQGRSQWRGLSPVLLYTQAIQYNNSRRRQQLPIPSVSPCHGLRSLEPKNM